MCNSYFERFISNSNYLIVSCLMIIVENVPFLNSYPLLPLNAPCAPWCSVGSAGGEMGNPGYSG